MTKIVKLSSRKHLNELLRVISEESVIRAFSDVKRETEEERIRQTQAAADLAHLNASNKKEKKLEEEDDEADVFAKSDKKKAAKKGEDVFAKSDKKKSAKEEPAKAEPEAEQEPSGDEPVDPPTVEDAITFSMIKDKINTIRSGRSLRDKDIRQQLKDYFKELDSAEREALHTFLDGVAQILTAGIDSGEAPDPSEDPHNISMSKDDDDDDDDDEDEEPLKKKKKKMSVPAPSQSVNVGAEDSSPPIDVGRKQRTEALRIRVKALMG